MAKKKIYTAAANKFLYKYLNNASPTGHEAEGQKIWLDYIKPYVDTHIVDNYGSVAGVINPKAKFKVVIEAHADEIGWYVNYITKDGMIHVIRLGGSDHLIAPAKRVNIHTKKGVVKGVFGWPAIHTRGRGTKEDTPKVENIVIDCGVSSDEELAELGVRIGCPITFEDELMELNEKYFVGRALDNRMGGFMIAQVARLLHENKKKLPFGLYVVNAVQEEIGLRGAQMMADSIKPDVAIVTDVTHDTNTAMIKKVINGDIKCNLGPVIKHAPATHNLLVDLIEKVAEDKKIPFQRRVASRSTGTDTDSFAYSNGGVPSALISLPLRYMHTTVEMTGKSDVENTIYLIYETLLKLKPSFNFKYL